MYNLKVGMSVVAVFKEGNSFPVCVCVRVSCRK